MSDFIMEQEVVETENNDLEIMESFMNVLAIGAVAEAYCEHAAIAGFAAENGLNVFSESAGDIVNKAWNTTKEFFSKIWEWLKSIVSGIIRFFTKSSVDRLIVKLKEYKEKGKFQYEDEGKDVLVGINPAALDVDDLFTLVDDFSEYVKSKSEGSGAKSFIEKAEAFLKKDTVKEKFKKDNDKFAALDEVISVLEKMSKADIPSKGRKLLKKLEFNKKNYKKGGEGDDKDKINKDLVKEIKKAANLVAKAYDTYVSNTVKLVNKVLKKNISEEKDYAADNKFRDEKFNELKAARKPNPEPETKTTGESFVDSTDDFSFLN